MFTNRHFMTRTPQQQQLQPQLSMEQLQLTTPLHDGTQRYSSDTAQSPLITTTPMTTTPTPVSYDDQYHNTNDHHHITTTQLATTTNTTTPMTTTSTATTNTEPTNTIHRRGSTFRVNRSALLQCNSSSDVTKKEPATHHTATDILGAGSEKPCQRVTTHN